MLSVLLEILLLRERRILPLRAPPGVRTPGGRIRFSASTFYHTPAPLSTARRENSAFWYEDSKNFRLSRFSQKKTLDKQKKI